MKIEEGYIPFREYKTYYRMAEATDSSLPPLLLLHGGPGSTHNYMEVFDCLAESGRTVISYDQIGCGKSYVDGHPELWVMETWMEELKTVRRVLKLDRCHILGQSWGGMLLLQYLTHEKPEGIVSAILSSTLPDSLLWGREQHRVLHYLSEEDQAAIRRAEETGNFKTPECEAATDRFMKLRCAGDPGPDDPECLRRPKKAGTESYIVGWGDNEYTPSGTLKSYNVTDLLPTISVPCLVMSGTDDLCTPLVAKTMHDGIENSSWYLFPGSRHMCFVEQHDLYMKLLKKWLTVCDEGKAVRDMIRN